MNNNSKESKGFSFLFCLQTSQNRHRQVNMQKQQGNKIHKGFPILNG